MHLIVQLKENQPSLCQSAKTLSAAVAPLSRVETVDKNKRNRHETRIISVFDATAAVMDAEWKTHVNAVIHVERIVYTRQTTTGLLKPSRESSFYLSNRLLTAETAAGTIRKHWGIENTSHHTRDVTFREDASRIRKKPGIFARMRTFAYNILQCNKSDTMPQDRFAAACGGIETILKMNF